MSFGDQLKKRREELGLSRSELADRLRVSRSAVGNYETGVSAPKEEVLLRLFDALHVEPNYLYRDAYRGGGEGVSDEERSLLEKYRRLGLSGRQTLHTVAGRTVMMRRPGLIRMSWLCLFQERTDFMRRMRRFTIREPILWRRSRNLLEKREWSFWQCMMLIHWSHRRKIAEGLPL